MSAIMGRYVRDSDMSEGAELCLECADAFDWGSSSPGRRNVTVMWVIDTPTCAMQGAEKCWTPKALRENSQ